MFGQFSKSLHIFIEFISILFISSRIIVDVTWSKLVHCYVQSCIRLYFCIESVRPRCATGQVSKNRARERERWDRQA